MPILVLGLLLFSALGHAQVTQLTASVDRNTMLLDESINLTLLATGSVDRDDADFSAFTKDFRVGRPSFSMSTQIINGNMKRNVSWTVNLQAKQTGRFEIPSIELDGQRSKAFFVNVLAVDTSASSLPRDFYITASVNETQIFLQQQLLYTLKIHLSRDIQRGTLNLPTLDGALIEQIGEDIDYQEIIDGVRYRIIERKYALIPQSSGNFTIRGPIFEGEVLTNSRQSFANFGRTRSITRRAPDININVSPIPQDYSYAWLPSQFVEVNQEWQGDVNKLVVGEPITRTIILTAAGLTKEQLPQVITLYHPDFKVYPEQANLDTIETATALVSQSTFNTAIIPSKSGNYVLPEVRVPWFNVNTGQTEFAVIPAKSVIVSAKANGSQALTQQTAPATANDVIAESESQKALVETGHYPNWLVFALISTNLLTLVSLIIVWSTSQSIVVQTVGNEQGTKQPYTGSEAVLFNQLKNSLEQGETDKTSPLLDAWLAQLFGAQHHSVSLSLLKHGDKGSDTDENDLLRFYNQILANKATQSSDTNPQIDFMAFIKQLQTMRQIILQQKHHSVITALYPK